MLTQVLSLEETANSNKKGVAATIFILKVYQDYYTVSYCEVLQGLLSEDL